MRSDNPSWFSWPFARLWNRSAPNSDRPVYIFGPDLSQPQPTNIDVAIVPRGTGAISAQVPDSTVIGGNKRGDNSADFQLSRTGADKVAAGSQSFIGSGNNNRAAGTQSVVCGGNFNTAGNTQSVVCGGESNSASGSQAVIAGGFSNTASGSYAVISGGTSNSSSALSSTVGGGNSNQADGTNSVVPGGSGGITRGLTGRLSFSSGTFASGGDAQYGLIVLRRSTTDATPLAITSTNVGASSINIPVLPNSGLYAFRGQVACIQTAGIAGAVNDCKAWDIAGSIKRNTNAASTALLGTPTITVLGADTNLGADNATGAVIAITADTSAGGLLITVTGETNKTLRWVATVQTTEVDY